MKNPSTLKTTASALALGLALAMSSGAALAQAVPMTMAVVNAHKADLDNMLADMAKIKTQEIASGYERYLVQQMNDYVKNHKKLDAAIPSVAVAKRANKFTVEMKTAVDAINALNDNQYVKVSAEMDRLEKLNPGLKKQFDVLRALND